MSKICAKSCPGADSHPNPGLRHHKPPVAGPLAGCGGRGPHARLQRCLQGCRGVGGEGPAAEHPVVLLCSQRQTYASRSSSERGRDGHDLGPSTELEAKIKHTHELNVVPRGAGTTSGETLKERGLSCTPLLRLMSPRGFHKGWQVLSPLGWQDSEFFLVVPKEGPRWKPSR